MKVQVMQYLNPEQRKQFYQQKKSTRRTRTSAGKNEPFRNILLAILRKVPIGGKAVKVSKEELINAMFQVFPDGIAAADVTFVCIGTDRATGDSLGPLVGSMLEAAGYTNVIGTIDNPIHAKNLNERLMEIQKGSLVIAIDACLGLETSIGRYYVESGPCKPGAGVGNRLTPLGDYHITGIVNVGGFMEYFVLQNTRLSRVMDMARAITIAVQSRFPLIAQEVAASLENEL